MKYLNAILLITISIVLGHGQTTKIEDDTIRIQNGSFEVPSLETSQWIDMGDSRFSPPDLHTPKEILQNVKSKAHHGTNFISMVTRKNDTNEAIGQSLKVSIEPGQKYELKFQTMQSPEFLAMSYDKKEDSFERPIHLRVYGYSITDINALKTDNCQCTKTELLFESELIDSEDWVEQVAILQPTKTANFLLFKAFWETPILIPYNGHLLLDNVSHLVKVKD